MIAMPDGTFHYFTIHEAAPHPDLPQDYVFHRLWGEIMR